MITGDYTNRILYKHKFIFYRIGPWRPCAMCIYPLRGKGKFRHFQWLSCACSWPRILSNIFLYFTIIAGLGIRSSVFSSESFVFVWSKEQNSDSLLEKSTSLPSLFFKERRVKYILKNIWKDSSANENDDICLGIRQSLVWPTMRFVEVLPSVGEFLNYSMCQTLIVESHLPWVLQ